MNHDLTPMMYDNWLQADGVGHVSDIGDANARHTPRGCRFQAWSLAKLLRFDRIVLAEKTDLRTQSAPSNI